VKHAAKAFDRDKTTPLKMQKPHMLETCAA